ncbi:MAG: helix-turn-helix domain-containing protein [Candidatus Pacebacteria bacterium]|nr:helix-turn-helix domain-containing protein [Candidatus Paceibacterota bacterium]
MTAKKLPREDQPLIDQLAVWGLSRAEAEVYVYLLQKTGESGGSKIAVGTGLHRQYVYIALEKLINAGLVETVTFGKHSKYKARSPLEIEKITRKKSIVANDLVHELNKISAIHNDQDFEVLQGAKQIQQYEMDYAYESVEGEEEFILGGHSKGFADLMGDQLTEYLTEKNGKGIKVLYLGSGNERDFYKTSIGLFPNQEYRFMSNLPQGVTHMVVRKDTVLFFSFLTPPLVYVIKSKTVAENYKQFFMMLWDMAK